MQKTKEKVLIASDHAGFEMKEFLLKKLQYLVDLGTYSNTEKVDYNDYAELLVEKIINNKGILICGTGIGMSIAANRHRFIRAALCHTCNAAELARQHNDANVLVLSGKRNFAHALKIVKTFLCTDFSNVERHIRRVKKLC